MAGWRARLDPLAQVVIGRWLGGFCGAGAQKISRVSAGEVKVTIDGRDVGPPPAAFYKSSIRQPSPESRRRKKQERTQESESERLNWLSSSLPHVALALHYEDSYRIAG